MEQLKPCPFCGEYARLFPVENEKGEVCSYFVECMNIRECGIHTYTMDSKEKATIIWNRRTNEDL